MTSAVHDIMTTELVTCPADATVAEAARLMRDHDIGDVLVTGDDDRQLLGIVTDRDLVVRSLADGSSGNDLVGHLCSGDLCTVDAASDVRDAARIMAERALRRLPVVDEGRLVGIVSLGDLAVEQGAESVLGSISAAAPNE